MMRSLYTGVSGLSNHQTRMDVLSNNIANVNTTGFKASRTVFSSALSQTIQGATSPQGNVGGINAKQIGLGVKTAAIDILFTKTSFQTTNVNTDLAINDNGFFIVNNGAQSFYTRAGNFGFDEDGSFVNVDGLKVMGWLADKNGNINTAAPIEAIKIPVTDTMDPNITTYLNAIGNLNSSAALGMANSNSKEVYDSQGFAHRTTTMYTKIGDNEWLAATDVKGVEPGTTVQGAIKRISFDAYGKYLGATDVTLPGQPSKAIFLTGFSSKLNLPNNATLGATMAQVRIPYTDSDGNPQDVLLDAKCTKGETKTANVNTNNQVAFNFPRNATVGATATGTITYQDVDGNNQSATATATCTQRETITHALSSATSLNLLRDAATGANVTTTIPYQDANGNNHNIIITATCAAGETAAGANDAKWNITYNLNGTTQTKTYNDPIGTQPVWTPMATALPNGDTVTFTPNTLNITSNPGANSVSTTALPAYNSYTTYANDAKWSITYGTQTQTITPPATTCNWNSVTTPGANAGDDTVFKPTTTFTFDSGFTATTGAIATNPTTSIVGHADAEWEVEFDLNGVKQTHTYSPTSTSFSWQPMTATLPNGDTVSFTPNAQTNLAAGIAPSATKTDPTRTVGTAVSGAFTTVGIELDSNAKLNDVQESAITFMDSNGIARALGVKATCTATPTATSPATWKLEFIENGKVVGSQSYSTIGAGNSLPPLTLSDGSLVAFVGSTVKLDNQPTAINTVPVTPQGTDMALSFQPAGGTANPLTINMSYNALTQYAGGFNMGSSQQDGYPAGDLEDKVIDASGTIMGKYSNGQMLALGQVATAIFNNQQGLERAGSTLFTKSNNSGDPIIGTAGTGGRGTMQAGALEMANVDLSEEFTNMIVTQRGYQSNSRIITVSDEMLQELLNLKR